MTNTTIVVPLDGSEYSERALAVAATLADRTGGGLLLVTAAAGGPLHPLEYLEETAATVRAAGCKTEVYVAEQPPVDALVSAVADVDGIVCMMTHGRGRLRWAALGSVAEEVLRRVDHPVVLVGRHCRQDFLVRSSRLLACVDGAGTGRALAPVVDEWAARLGLDVEVAIVVHPLDVVSAEREQELLQELRTPFTGVDRAAMLTSRFVAGALADHADAMPAAVVAISAHGRGGLSRFALGSVTMGVVHLANCPVLVVRAAAAPGGSVTGAER